ncbi:MAG: Type-2 restriction enzyme BsuMI component YdiS [Saprospiraceae bacterium]|nr:Type-2 restriction enzyme BsuMI component YdiS [Saprospiraceae bacterium]
MPIQKILFGSPGTGKSHRIVNSIIPNQLLITSNSNIIKTVFHPEYTYGDFVGKLVPFTKAGRVEYKFHPGHFLIALSQAYKNILDNVDSPDNVVLVIDEINRGNSAAIFGTVFQLLDREPNGWSSYFINVTELEILTILELIGVKFKALADNKYEYKFPGETHEVQDHLVFQNRVDCLNMDLKQKRIFIPPNLSLLATMNTSDNSIYFMDNAFKRRWDWEFVNIEDDNQRSVVTGRQVNLYGQNICAWNDFVDRLNGFIRSHYKTVRKIEDKQIGYLFINEHEINHEHIKNKLMFFVWDSVFNTNRKPLTDLLEMNERDLVTFGQFTQQAVVKKFVQRILEFNV